MWDWHRFCQRNSLHTFHPMSISGEIAAKMGIIASEDVFMQLRNICLYSVYQRNQMAVDACGSYEDVLKLGIIPKHLQNPEKFQFRSHLLM